MAGEGEFPKTDGDILFASEVNTFTRGVHRKVYSSAAEETTTSSSFQDSSKTFILSAPVNSLIIGLFINAELKTNTTGYAGISLKISGTNLGNQYLVRNFLYTAYTDYCNSGCVLSTTESQMGRYDTTLMTYGPGYVKSGNFLNHPLKVLDTNTTFMVRKAIAAAQTGYIKNVIIEVIYVENFEEDA